MALRGLHRYSRQDDSSGSSFIDSLRRMDRRNYTNLKVLHRRRGSPIPSAASDTSMPVSCSNITGQAAAHTRRHLTLLCKGDILNTPFVADRPTVRQCGIHRCSRRSHYSL